LTEPTITPLGDTALTVTFGSAIDPALNALVAAFAERLRAANIPGVTDVVAGYSALSVHYNPVTIGYRDIRSRVQEIVRDPSPANGALESRLHRIPVRYNGEDLE
jgi:allophanate hydrolase subunit 1